MSSGRRLHYSTPNPRPGFAKFFQSALRSTRKSGSARGLRSFFSVRAKSGRAKSSVPRSPGHRAVKEKQEKPFDVHENCASVLEETTPYRNVASFQLREATADAKGSHATNDIVVEDIAERAREDR